MIEFKSKALTIIVNIILGIWQLFCWLPGIIGLAIFHNCEIYRNKDAGIMVIKVNKGNFIGSACFSCGPIIFVTPNCDENIIKHETGHSVQSLMFGPLFHFVVSLPSIVQFWIRRIKHKDAKWYHSHWPEGGCKYTADDLGHVDVSEYGL